MSSKQTISVIVASPNLRVCPLPAGRGNSSNNDIVVIFFLPMLLYQNPPPREAAATVRPPRLAPNNRRRTTLPGSHRPVRTNIGAIRPATAAYRATARRRPACRTTDSRLDDCGNDDEKSWLRRRRNSSPSERKSRTPKGKLASALAHSNYVTSAPPFDSRLRIAVIDERTHVCACCPIWCSSSSTTNSVCSSEVWRPIVSLGRADVTDTRSIDRSSDRRVR